MKCWDPEKWVKWRTESRLLIAICHCQAGAVNILFWLWWWDSKLISLEVDGFVVFLTRIKILEKCSFVVIVKNLWIEILKLSRRFFREFPPNVSILMKKLMLSYFVAGILGNYFYFFHIVQDYYILGLMYHKNLPRCKKLEVLVSERGGREREIKIIIILIMIC